MTVPAEPDCSCGHPAEHHPPHADHVRRYCLGHAFSPATGDELSLSVCPCTQYEPIADAV